MATVETISVKDGAIDDTKDLDTSAKDLQTRMRNILSNDHIMAYVYLITWFTLNVVITLYCKAIFSVRKFPYPVIMTAIHLFFTSLGVQLCVWFGLFTPKALTAQNLKTVVWFSVIFSLNIWLSNASLMAVSVNLHQVVRTTIPLFTMTMSLLFFHESYPLALLPSVIVVIGGVGATVWGDMEFDAFGMTIVILGCVLSSLKGILTQKTQVGSLGMSSLDLLRWLSPLAVVQLLVISFGLGEISKIQKDENIDRILVVHLVVLGWIAFGVNFVSFRNAALNNPLTLNIAGNVKQVLTSLLSIWIFGGVLGPALGVGIFATAVGAFWYSFEMQRWRGAKKRSEEVKKAEALELQIHEDSESQHTPLVDPVLVPVDKEGKPPLSAASTTASTDREESSGMMDNNSVEMYRFDDQQPLKTSNPQGVSSVPMVVPGFYGVHQHLLSSHGVGLSNPLGAAGVSHKEE